MLRFLPVLALAVACTPDSEPRVVESAPVEPLTSDFYPSGDSAARMAGEMPTIGRFDALATEVFQEAYYQDLTYLEVHTVTDQGWAMFGVEFNWDELLETGETQASYAMGCSGPSFGDYTFDGGADDVIVAMATDPVDASLETDAMFTIDFGPIGQIVALVPRPSDQ